MESSIDGDLKSLKHIWWLALLIGLASLVVGIFFVVSPHESLAVYAVVIGILLLFDGLLAVIESIFGRGEGRGVLATVGVLSLIAGVILIKHPFSTVTVFVMIFGIWLLAAGLVRLVVALSNREDRATGLAIAAIDIIAGLVILTWPDISLSVLAVIAGIILIIRGIAAIYAGILLRGAAKEFKNQLQGA